MPCCADCAKMDLNDTNKYGEFWCGERNRYYPGSDSTCSYFVDRNSDRCCYLTTITVHCLGYDDNCQYLETLRHFRDSIMQPNPIYQPILIEYDNIGPKITKKIVEDPNNKILSKKLMSNYIKPVCRFLEIQNYNEAIKLYQDMVIKLKKHYNLS